MIYIVRHGQTKLNKKGVLQGRSDNPLNELGRQQVMDTARWFRKEGIIFDRVYSSPLHRAIETAKILAPGVVVRTEQRLIEMDYGPYEGLDMDNAPQELLTFFEDFVNNPAPEGMEQLSEVVKRTGDFIEELADMPGNTLISTHAIAMKGILEYLTPGSKGSYWSTFIGNCAVYRTANENGMFTVPRLIYAAPRSTI